MSDIQKIYNGMWDNAIPRIKEGNYELDNLINSAADTRRGVTVLSYLILAVILELQYGNF